MPTKRYKITNNQTGESRVIDWDGDTPPTSDDVKNYFKRISAPRPDNQKSSYPTITKYYQQLREGLNRGYENITRSLAPDLNYSSSPQTEEEAREKVEHPIK